MASVLLRSYMDCSGSVLLLSVCTMDEYLSRWQVVLGFAQVLPLREWWSSWPELSCWNCWKYDSVCFRDTLCTEDILFWDCEIRCVTSVQSFPLVLPPPNLSWQKHQFRLPIFCFSRRVLFSCVSSIHFLWPRVTWIFHYFCSCWRLCWNSHLNPIIPTP